MDRRFADWYRSAFGHGLAGMVVLWAALPPLGLWPLAWIAPAWWVLLIRRSELPGKRPYAALWLAGFLFWLAELYWLTFPHAANSIGWLAVGAYFGFYLPVFVGLAHVAVHRLRVPVILAAPIVWTGLELAQAHLLTGMTMASLGHTQYRWIALIQISDLAGAFGVGFVVMFVAACLARMLPLNGKPKAIWPLAPVVGLLAAVLLYGHLRMAGVPPVDQRPPPVRIALIQGSIDSKLKSERSMRGRIHEHYRDLSQKAVEEYGPVDLIVWPETMFRETFITCEPDAEMPDIYRQQNWTRRQFQGALEEEAEHSRAELGTMARAFGVPMVIGVDHHHYGAEGVRMYNAAVFVDRSGNVVGHYDKMHRVVFGEYVPFGEYFPRLQRMTPLPVSIHAGERPAAFDVGGLRVSPNICYETILSHVIRRQINTLRREGNEPDVLANLTNDGWFRGSSELDLHLICGVFRAVECRKPLVIAANTGFSARIDGDGRIRERGPRRAAGTILAEVRPDPRGSWYLRYGDWPAGLCLAACVFFAVVGLRQRFLHQDGQVQQGKPVQRQRDKRSRKKRC